MQDCITEIFTLQPLLPTFLKFFVILRQLKPLSPQNPSKHGVFISCPLKNCRFLCPHFPQNNPKAAHFPRIVPEPQQKRGLHALFSTLFRHFLQTTSWSSTIIYLKSADLITVIPSLFVLLYFTLPANKKHTHLFAVGEKYSCFSGII